MNNGEANKTYYDIVSGFYDQKHNISTNDYEIFKNDIIDLVGSEITGQKILDCGCGTGRGAFKFALMGNEVMGIDISDSIIEVCKQNAANSRLNINFLSCDCTNLPFEDNTFDVVTTSAALHHVENINSALIEFKRVLKKQGRLLFIAEPKKAIIRPKWMIDRKEYLSNRYDEQLIGKIPVNSNPDVHIFDLKEFMGLIYSLGFENIVYKTFNTSNSIYRDLFFYKMKNLNLRNNIQNTLIKFDRRVLKILPDSFKSLFNLTAQKNS